MTFRWEVRRSLVYGSRHERWFSSEKEAIDYMVAEIKSAGLGGSYKRADDVFYYGIYPDDTIMAVEPHQQNTRT